MYKDLVEYVKNGPWCQVDKGRVIKTKPGSIIANGPLYLLYINFTKMDPSEEGKDLVLTDAFSKFSQVY